MTPRGSEDLQHGVATHIGLERESQEDAYVVAPPLFGVADGVGGHAGGDVASRTALEVLSQVGADDRDALVAAVHKANEVIVEKASDNPDLSGMGTTVTALLANGEKVHIAHVGDSRAYVLRDGELRRLTRDHTLVARMVRQGRLSQEEADVHPARSRIERALGAASEVKVDVEAISPRPGDRFLLCTDGLSGPVDDDEILQILEDTASAEDAANRLVDAAVRAGGHDNVTALVVDIPGKRRTASEISRAKRRRRRWIALGAMLFLLAAGAAAGKLALDASWYLGVDEDEVAVFRGIPGSVGGIPLGRVEWRTGLPSDLLPEPYRGRVNDGLKVEDRQEAEEVVAELRSLSDRKAETRPPPP